MRQLIFQRGVSLVGHTISNLPTLPDDVVISRGMFGHYLSRKVQYNAGDKITPRTFQKTKDKVLFNTRDFSFEVPISDVKLFNTDTGKTTDISPKVYTEIETYLAPVTEDQEGQAVEPVGVQA